MKKLLATIACIAITVAVHAQGSVNFNNFVSGSVNAPVFAANGVTKLSGTQFAVQLYGGAVTSDATSLSAIGAALNFRTGAGAGYVSGGGERDIAAVAPGANATIQLRAWDTTTGSSWETATIRGESALLTLATGGAGSPPSLPADLVGLQSFSLVPEPSTIALGVLGMAGLVFIRRRK